MRNRSYNYVRDKKQTESIQNDDDETPIINLLGVEDEDILQTEELSSTIEQAVKNLPEKTREVFLLSRIEGLKYAEIAERMDISVKTVEAQMSRALKQLRKDLAEFLSILLVLIINNSI